MFDNLTERLSGTFRKLTGKASLTENNIQDALREVRRALLEADVALPVVKDFIDRITLRAVGQEVSSSLTPGQAFIKLVQAEMVALMGSANASRISSDLISSVFGTPSTRSRPLISIDLISSVG